MPTATQLARISAATDIDLNQNLRELSAIVLPGWVVFPWYRDTTYGSDEYGCTSIPNIFHLWLVDLSQLNGQTPPNVPHVNVLGSECVDHWLWGNIVAFVRQGKKYLVIGGGRYEGANTITPRLIIVDITDPNNPQVVKQLEDTGTKSSAHHVLYCPKSDTFYVVTSDGVLRKGTWDEVMNATSLRDLTAVKDYGTVVALIALTQTKALVYNDSQGIYEILNMETGQIEGTFTPPSGHFPVTSTKKLYILERDENANIVAVHVYDPDTLTEEKVFNLPSPVPAPSPAWALAVAAVGDVILWIVDNTLYVIDVANETVNTVTLPINVSGTVPINMYEGALLLFEKGDHCALTNGWLYKVVLDAYVYARYDPSTKKVCVYDEAGNPVANRTLYIGEITPATWNRGGATPKVTRTTGSDGCVDISDLTGMLRIEL